MDSQGQLAWLASAADALEGISAQEIAHVSVEVRRSITRPSQIVPEIVKLVSEKRARASRSSVEQSPFSAEREINEKARERRAKARSQRDIEQAFEWERDARFRANLSFMPKQPPLNRRELSAMPAHIRAMGINGGFLKRDGELVVEVNDPDETDRIREQHRRGNNPTISSS
jgi:hypothetical protein